MKIETILYPGSNLMKKSQIVMENHVNKLRAVKALNRGMHYIDLQITGNSKLTPPKFCETEKLTIIFQRFKYVTVKAYVKSVKKKKLCISFLLSILLATKCWERGRVSSHLAILKYQLGVLQLSSVLALSRSSIRSYRFKVPGNKTAHLQPPLQIQVITVLLTKLAINQMFL